jgi:hypothetical protein
VALAAKGTANAGSAAFWKHLKRALDIFAIIDV